MRYLSLLVMVVVGCGAAEAPSPSTTASADTGQASGDSAAATDTNVAMTDDTGTAPADTATSTDTGTVTTDTATPPTYPAGPYGTDVGKVVANLDLEGYVRFEPTTGLATSATYGPTSFADLRAKSPKKHALIHVSGFT